MLTRTRARQFGQGYRHPCRRRALRPACFDHGPPQRQEAGFSDHLGGGRLPWRGSRQRRSNAGGMLDCRTDGLPRQELQPKRHCERARGPEGAGRWGGGRGGSAHAGGLSGGGAPPLSFVVQPHLYSSHPPTGLLVWIQGGLPVSSLRARGMVHTCPPGERRSPAPASGSRVAASS